MLYKLLYNNQNPLKFVLTYKVSQNHTNFFLLVLEWNFWFIILIIFSLNILWAAIIYKKYNYYNFDEFKNGILEFCFNKRSVRNIQEETRVDVDGIQIQTFLDQLNNLPLREYITDILDYISGYIVQALTKHQSDHIYTTV